MREFFGEEEDSGDDMGRLFDMQEVFPEDNAIVMEYANHVNVNRMILDTTLRLLERSFWWRFKFHDTKLAILKDTYKQIHTLLLEDVSEGELDSELDTDLDDIEPDESSEEDEKKEEE